MVVLNQELEFREVAETIAEARDTSVITDLRDVEMETVVYVDPPTKLDESILFELQRRHLEHGPQNAKFSVVTGFTPEIAQNLYFRERVDDGDHCVVSSYPIKDFQAEDSLVIKETDEASATTLEQLQSDQRLSSLAFVSSGWSMHLRLPEGYVCGYPHSQDASDYDGREAYCVQDGEKDCPLEGDHVVAEDLAADDVFLTSCASVIDNNLYRLPVHVGTSLLTNATTLIGSYRVSPAVPGETLLHYALLRSGYSLSERCYYLNQNAVAIDLKAYPYIPFGRPESAPETTTAGSYDTEVAYKGPKIEFSLTNVETNLINLTVPRDSIPAADRYYLHPCDKAADIPLYYYIAPEGDRLRVVAYAGGKIEAESLSFSVSPNPIRDQDRLAAIDAATNANDLRAIGALNTKKGANQQDNLFHELYTLANDLGDERYYTGNYDVIDETVESFLYDTIQIAPEIVESVAENGLPIQTYAKRMMEIDARASERTCFACGRRVFVREGVDVTGEIRRVQGKCPLCGPVFDVPAESGGIANHHPTIEGELVDTDQQVTEFTVSFENPFDHPMYGEVAVRVSDFVDSYSDPIDPAESEFELAVGEELQASYTVDTGEFDPNFYTLLAYVVGNNELYTAMTPLLVGEKGGFRYHFVF